MSAENFWPQILQLKYPIRALSSLRRCQRLNDGPGSTHILHETAFSWLQNRHVKTVSGRVSEVLRSKRARTERWRLRLASPGLARRLLALAHR